MQIHTPTFIQGGVDETRLRSFFLNMLQYFETILPLVERLQSS